MQSKPADTPRLLCLVQWLPRDVALIIVQYLSERVEPVLLEALYQLEQCRPDDIKADDASSWVYVPNTAPVDVFAYDWVDLPRWETLRTLFVHHPTRGLSTTEAQRRLSLAGPNRMRNRRERGLCNVRPIISGDLEELYDKLRTRPVIVLRDSIWTAIDPMELVRGDIAVLREGYVVPADARVLAATDNFAVDMAVWNGEAYAVQRSVENTANGRAWMEATCVVLSPCPIVSGAAIVTVVATGMDTLEGSFSELLQEVVVEENIPVPWCRRNALRESMVTLAKQHGVVVRRVSVMFRTDTRPSLFSADVPVVPSDEVLRYLLSEFNYVLLLVPPEVLGSFFSADEVKGQQGTTRELCYRYNSRRHLRTDAVGVLSHREHDALNALPGRYAMTAFTQELHRVRGLPHSLSALILDGRAVPQHMLRMADVEIYRDSDSSPSYALDWVQPLLEASKAVKDSSSCCSVQ